MLSVISCSGVIKLRIRKLSSCLSWFSRARDAWRRSSVAASGVAVSARVNNCSTMFSVCCARDSVTCGGVEQADRKASKQYTGSFEIV